MSRIAVFHNLPSGGAKRALYEWVRRLSGHHEIDVYTLSTANHDYCDLRPYVSAYHVTPYQELPLFQSPLGRLNQLQRYRDLGRLKMLYQDMARRIDAANYDVVFLNPCIFTFIPLLQLYLNTPALYYLHEHFGNRVARIFKRDYLKTNPLREGLNRLDPLISLYRNTLRRLQETAVQRTKRFLANSEFTRRQFEADFHVEAPVVYYGVNSQVFRPLPDVVRGSHVLSVGEMSPRKGFDFLIESLALLPPAIQPELRLACNSQIPEERAYIEQFAASCGVKITVLNNLNPEQLAVEYNQARVVVYSPVLEPFGLVPLEAMACATPVVGVAEGGVLESVIDGVTGRLSPRSPQPFATAIKEVLDQPEKAHQWGQKGRELVLTRWSWEQSSLELEKYLMEMNA